MLELGANWTISSTTGVLAGIEPLPVGTVMDSDPTPVAPGVYVDIPSICKTPLMYTLK
ncbi:hypothetical protein B23_2067 [Geobacillus thermoleovorans B23]|nr:hypothetical protein B23_2067 [Geobacillus thermoleovorans B23]